MHACISNPLSFSVCVHLYMNKYIYRPEYWIACKSMQCIWNNNHIYVYIYAIMLAAAWRGGGCNTFIRKIAFVWFGFHLEPVNYYFFFFFFILFRYSIESMLHDRSEVQGQFNAKSVIIAIFSRTMKECVRVFFSLLFFFRFSMVCSPLKINCNHLCMCFLSCTLSNAISFGASTCQFCFWFLIKPFKYAIYWRTCWSCDK